MSGLDGGLSTADTALGRPRMGVVCCWPPDADAERVPPAGVADAVACLLTICVFTCVRSWGSRAAVVSEARAGDARTRSQNSSYGWMTRMYDHRICVERPGTPPYPSRRPRSAHFLALFTWHDGSEAGR